MSKKPSELEMLLFFKPLIQNKVLELTWKSEDYIIAKLNIKDKPTMIISGKSMAELYKILINEI